MSTLLNPDAIIVTTARIIKVRKESPHDGVVTAHDEDAVGDSRRFGGLKSHVIAAI
jgi:hypothetical protein